MDAKERIKEIEEMIDGIQKHVEALEKNIRHPDEFVAVGDFRASMNDAELTFHEVRKVNERRID